MDKGGEVVGGKYSEYRIEVFESGVCLGNYIYFRLVGGKRGEMVWWSGWLVGVEYRG